MLLFTVKLIKKTLVVLLMIKCIFYHHGTAINHGIIDTPSDIAKLEGIPKKRSVSGKKIINLCKHL